MSWLVFVEVLVWSQAQCNRLRIWHCLSYCIGCKCGSDLIPGLGTSTCCRCGQKSKQNNLKTELPYGPAIPLLDIYPGKVKILIWKDTCTPVFTVAIIIAKRWKQSKRLLINRWMDKEDVMYIYIYTGILLSHKKERNIAICSNMYGLEIIIPDEVSHTKINAMWYVKSKKKWYKWTYLKHRNWLIDIENKVMITKG